MHARMLAVHAHGSARSVAVPMQLRYKSQTKPNARTCMPLHVGRLRKPATRVLMV